MVASKSLSPDGWLVKYRCQWRGCQSAIGERSMSSLCVARGRLAVASGKGLDLFGERVEVLGESVRVRRVDLG
jgi:hypothetical protein